jgi:signal transduction histidine kinase
MDYQQKLTTQVKIVLFVAFLLDNVALFAVWYYSKAQGLPGSAILLLLFVSSLIFMFAVANGVGAFIMQPVRLLWRNVRHADPDSDKAGKLEKPPKSTTLWLGKDLVANLTGQIQHLASEADRAANTSSDLPNFHQNVIANNLPMPLLVLDRDNSVVFANNQFLTYLGMQGTDLRGQPLANALNMSFDPETSPESFDAWLNKTKSSSATASNTWRGVRAKNADTQANLQFDLAAYYNRANPQHIETILVLFKRQEEYQQEDDDISFISLAVHELRTPLTLLRGYIEALEDETAGQLGKQAASDLQKMQVSAQQLTSFINSILSVARVENGQLELKLRQGDWRQLLSSIVDDLRMKAQLSGLTLELQTAENLPPAGLDTTSITEVITNLIDNAIKYSPGKDKIVIKSELTSDNLIQTTVQDFGVGVPESVVPALFSKFQRNHRNRAQISGTGLGLFLSKAIVSAHGGNIWISSKEGEGTTVGFTLVPYASLAAAQQASNEGITHNTHGWIKNHSMSRQ